MYLNDTEVDSINIYEITFLFLFYRFSEIERRLQMTNESYDRRTLFYHFWIKKQLKWQNVINSKTLDKIKNYFIFFIGIVL